MNKERNDLKAGIFIIISVALIIGVIIGIKGIGRFIEPSQHTTVVFKLTDDIGGLRKGDDVRVGGFKVGEVRDIDVVQRPGKQAEIVVSFTMPQRYQIRNDARVTVQGTLTGTSWLNFDYLGSPDAPLLAHNEALVGRPSVMSTIFAHASDLAPELTAAVQDVRTLTLPKVHTAIDQTTETVESFRVTSQHATALIKMLRARVDPVLERYYAVADNARDAAGHLRDIFGETKGDFKGTMANLNSATGTVDERLPGIMEKLDSGLAEVQKSIDLANLALEDIKEVAVNTKEATATARSVLVSNRSRIDGIVASVKATSDNLKFASAEIRRSPWRLLYKPGAGEVANLNLYDSARQFAEGAGSLSDAAAALRDALQDPQVSQEQIQKLVDRLDETFQSFSAVEQELWRQVK